MNTPQVRSANLAIVGAYMAEGLFSPNREGNTEHRERLLDNSPGGHIGIVTDICAYAEYALDLCNAARAVTDDYPGVWEYEVIDCFGAWYGKRLVETDHQQPTSQQCRVYLLNETQAFFRQSGPIDDAALTEALCSVPFMEGKFND